MVRPRQHTGNPGSVQFISAGTHTVRVSVTDQSNGKSATDIITVVVEAVIGGMVDPTMIVRGRLIWGINLQLGTGY